MAKNLGGRPIEWTADRIEECRLILDKMCEQLDFFAMAQFLAKVGAYRELLPDFRSRCARFVDTERKANACMEANIISATARGGCPPAFGIFVMKNKGWSDKQEVDITSKGESVGAATLCVYGKPT